MDSKIEDFFTETQEDCSTIKNKINSKDMMTKEQFIKRMSLIQNWDSECETLSVLGEKIFDGYCVPQIGSYLIDIILDMINEDLHIEDKELISWWLWEDVDKVIYVDEKEISVRTLEELYAYIIDTK